MDFARVLNQSFQENAPKQSDATKQLLEQGMNFQKTMSGERGIMAAIESAHLRPKIAAFIKGKLNSVSSDDVLNQARNIGTRLTGRPATRGEIAGPRAPPVVTENKVLARGPSETGLVQEGGFQSLAPGRGIADRFGSDPVPSIEGSRLTRGLDASNNPLNPRNVANVGQSERVPELDTPEDLPGLRGPAAVSRAALAEADSGEVTTSRAASSLIAARPVSTVKVLPTAEDLAAAAPAVTRTGALARATPKPPSEPAQAAMGTRAPAAAEAAEPIGKLGSAGNPLRGDQAPPPPGRGAPEDFPSPPSSIPPPARAAAPAAPEPVAPEEPIPPPARGMTDEELAQRLSRVKEIGTGEEEASSLASSLGSGARSLIGGLGTIGEGVGIGQALFSKNLSGSQRFSQIGQIAAPRAVGKAVDQFGLPKAPPGAGAGTNAAANTEKIGQEAADKALAEKLAAQGGKEAAIGSEEAAVPGIGDILAIGTALFGGIRAGVEAAKAKKEAENYTPPPNPVVAMDNAVSFDSSFR